MAADNVQSLELGLGEAVAFQRDLYLYWREVNRLGVLPLTTRGHVTRQALRHLRSRLAAAGQLPAPQGDPTELEEPRLYFLRRLLERLRLLRPAPEPARLLPADSADMARYIALPLDERLRLAVRLWVAGAWWPERLDVAVAPAGILAPAPPRVALARRHALDAIAAAGIGAAMPDPLPLHGPSGRRAPAQRGRTTKRMAARAVTTSRPMREAGLMEPLVWLGLVAAGPGDIFVATPAALALRSDERQDALREEHGPVAVLPNLTIIAYPPLTAPVLWLLDTCADEAALQQTATYTLTIAGIARARTHGLDATVLADRLGALTGKLLPANVRTTLDDWERRAARLRITPAAGVLEVRDSALLDALFADPATATWRDRRLAPTAALLKPDGVGPAREWLLRHGQIPARVPPPLPTAQSEDM